MNLTQIVFDVQKDQVTGNGANPNLTFSVRSNAGGDNFATSLGDFSPNGNSGHFDTDLTAATTGASFQDVTTPIEFRIYMFDEDARRFDNPRPPTLTTSHLMANRSKLIPRPSRNRR